MCKQGPQGRAITLWIKLMRRIGELTCYLDIVVETQSVRGECPEDTGLKGSFENAPAFIVLYCPNMLICLTPPALPRTFPDFFKLRCDSS